VFGEHKDALDVNLVDLSLVAVDLQTLLGF
jgi:hypothetical protein